MKGIIQKEIALKYIFGGNCYTTFLNTNSNNRFTYKVTLSKKDKSIYYICVLTGPDIYTYVGFYKNGEYFHSPKSSIGIEAQSVKVFNWVIFNLTKKTLPNFIEIWHDGRCGKCGKQLTVPKSVEIGIGPDCAKRLFTKEDLRDQKLSELLKGLI